MSIQNRYTRAINRLTIHAAKVDYKREFGGMPERKYNRLSTRINQQINLLHDYCKYLPTLVSAYGENEINTRELKALLG